MNTLKMKKIILHIITFRLKISTIKKVYNIYKIFEEIKVGKISLRKIKKVKPKDLMEAVNFNNRYTTNPPIVLEDYLNILKEKLRIINNPKLNILLDTVDLVSKVGPLINKK